MVIIKCLNQYLNLVIIEMHFAITFFSMLKSIAMEGEEGGAVGEHLAQFAIQLRF